MLELNPKTPLTESQKVSVSYISKGHHLLNLIKDVLDLAKINAGKVEFSLENVSVGQVIEECIPLIQIKASDRGIQIDNKTSSSEFDVVHADHMRFKQILLNLMSNAVKYNNEKGTVTVEFEPASDKRPYISITDTGVGIATEDHSELFKPFNRLGQERSAIEGTGIGLVVTKRLVEEMGGSIGFESEEGTGSTFWFELPLSKQANVTEGVLDQKIKIARIEQLAGTVLYVEDKPANLDLMEMIISRVDSLKIIFAHTAELDLDLARLESPDIIIMDIQLPGINGFEALKKLKQMDTMRETPVIALSANATMRQLMI